MLRAELRCRAPIVHMCRADVWFFFTVDGQKTNSGNLEAKLTPGVGRAWRRTRPKKEAASTIVSRLSSYTAGQACGFSYKTLGGCVINGRRGRMQNERQTNM